MTPAGRPSPPSQTSCAGGDDARARRLCSLPVRSLLSAAHRLSNHQMAWSPTTKSSGRCREAGFREGVHRRTKTPMSGPPLVRLHARTTRRARRGDPRFRRVLERRARRASKAPHLIGEKLAELRADPISHPLSTRSGRIELFSQTIAAFEYETALGTRPGWSAAEWLGAPLAERFPLHLISNQPRTRLHSQYDNGGTAWPRRSPRATPSPCTQPMQRSVEPRRGSRPRLQ